MKFTFGYHRAIVGNDIDVTIVADGKEVIERVRVVLDGFNLADESLDPPSVQYQRTFLQAGSAGPLMQHTLLAASTDEAGETRSATRKWQDQN